MRHAAQQTEHFVGLVRSEHGRRLVEYEQPLIEIEQFQDFEFLLFARRHGGHRNIERNAKRHAVEKRFERAHLLFPVDDGRRIGAADDEIFSAGHRGHQREVLIDHADAQRASVARIADRHFRAVEQDLAFVRRIEAHDAFDECRFAGAVLAEQRVDGSGLDLDRHIVERDQRTEHLGHADRLERGRAHRGAGPSCP